MPIAAQARKPEPIGHILPAARRMHSASAVTNSFIRRLPEGPQSAKVPRVVTVSARVQFFFSSGKPPSGRREVGILEAHEVGVDDPPASAPPVEPALKEDLRRPPRSRERAPVLPRRAMKRESAKRDQRLVKGRGPGLGPLVAVPSPFGPLPLPQALDEGLGALVGEPERERVPHRVSLLPRAAAHPVLLARENEGVRGKEMMLREQRVVEPVPQGRECTIARGVADFRQADEGEMSSLPLLVGVRGAIRR